MLKLLNGNDNHAATAAIPLFIIHKIKEKINKIKVRTERSLKIHIRFTQFLPWL